MIKLSELLTVCYEAVTVYDYNGKVMFRSTNLNRFDVSKLIESIPTATVYGLAGRVTDRHICELNIWTNETFEQLEKERIDYDIKVYEEKKRKEDFERNARKKRIQRQRERRKDDSDSLGK